MSKEKQIEEMARLLESFCELQDECSCIADCDECRATKLYEAGYRKQSDGEWEKRTFVIFDSEKVGYRCSECNTTWDTPTNYCPNCGAKMKGGE